jgi:hypothetical protein
MRDQVRRIPTISVLVLVTIMLVGALPVMAAAPQPVIPVPPGEASQEPPPDEPAPDEPEPDTGCLLGPQGGVATAGLQASLSHARGILVTYPGPVVPIEQQGSACEAQVSMSLVVTSSNGQKPEGADATLDELAVSRATLESGFDVTLPAGSRTITLSDPGEDWELMSVACTCSGGSAVAMVTPGHGRAPLGTLTSYPQPVIPVSLVTPGSADCGSSPDGGSAVDAAGGSLAFRPDVVSAVSVTPLSPTGLTTGQLLTYPGPVVPVPPTDEPGSPEPPTRQPGSVSWDQDGTVSIRDYDAAGGIFSCTWTVELVYGELALETKTEPTGREDSFAYRVTPDAAGIGKVPVSMRGVPPANTEKLWNGGWSVELADLDEGWEIERSDCRETDRATTSSASGTNASIGVDPADRVRCTFELKLLAPKPGSWLGRNGAGMVSCAGISFALPVSTDRARMRVRRDGDLLIARGVGSGSGTTWRFERDQQDLLRYRGTMTTRIAGARGTFETDLRLISEKRMKGRLFGKVKVRGTTCSFSRPLTLTHTGG